MENHNSNPPITVASAILKIQRALWETPSTPFDLLTAASALLSKPDYDDVITERTISGLCGYPTCPNPLPSPAVRRRKGKYRVSLSEHKVYDLEESCNYCCEECLIGSRAFKGSLSDRRRAGVDVKKLKVEGVLRLFGCFDGEGEEEGKLSRRDGVGKFKVEIKEKDGVRAGDVKLDEWIGPSNAIEGYVPQLDLDSKCTSNLGPVLRIDRNTGTEVHIEDKGDVVLSGKPSTLTNDVSEIITKQLQDVVITEMKKPSQKSSKSSKAKPQADAISIDINNVDYGNAGFTSSIFFGNELDVELPKKCAISTRIASEQIAKQLEDVVTAEKAATKTKTSKSPRSKSRKKASNNNSDNVDFQSTIVIGNSVTEVPPNTSYVSSVGAAKQSAENPQDNVVDSWHDTPPGGFSLTLSSFATMWMALFGWITCSSIAYIYGHDESSHEEFLVVNGREYPRKIFIRDGKSSEIRKALDGFICRALPGLVMDLSLPTPVSTLEKFVGRLFDTMTFVDAVPSLKMRQWQLIVMLFIEALSVHRLPSLAPQMTSRSTLVCKVLSAAQVSSEEYETMRDLIMPLGRLPQFSMQSGG